MSIDFIVGLLAITSGLTSYPLVAGSSWVDVSVIAPPPSPPVIDTENITYVYDELGQLQKVDIKKVKPQPVPYFYVERDVRFELFTLKNPIEPQILTFNNYSTVKESNFNAWHPTRILIHGWYSEGLLTPRFADAYLVRGNHKVNFIAVNWQKGSDVYNYLYARRRVKEVAEHVARFVDFMYEKAWMRISDLTLVGHSLGAHVAGITGKKITKGQVSRIVGLDPASPFFNYNDVDGRLAETDASYVEVIHTCAGTLGYAQPLGTASFYPNGGRAQPGCGWDMSGACAHGRAYEFYLESIVKPQFYAFQCESIETLRKGNCSVINHVVQMGGEPGTKKGRGIYYLQTNSESVFSRGKRGLLQAVLSSKKKTSLKTIIANLFSKKPVNETSDMNKEEVQKLLSKWTPIDWFNDENSSEVKVEEKNETVLSIATDSFNKMTVNATLDVVKEEVKNETVKSIETDWFNWKPTNVTVEEAERNEIAKTIANISLNKQPFNAALDVTIEEEKESWKQFLTNLFKKKTVDGVSNKSVEPAHIRV